MKTKSIADTRYISPAQVKIGTAKNSPNTVLRTGKGTAHHRAVVNHHDEHENRGQQRELLEEDR